MATTNVELNQLQPLLTEIKLKHFAAALQSSIQKLSPNEQDLILQTTYHCALVEKTERKSSVIESKIKSAKFKRIQTVDTYDFTHSKTAQSIQKNYLGLISSISKDNLPSAIFTGNAGLGKTHLARALGYAACQKNISTLFVTAAEMVNRLLAAQKIFQLENELSKFRRPELLIIDELGYVALDTSASNLFFQVISARHDQGLGTVATTNLSFGKFNQIFANDAIAHAIVDRLVADAEVFYMEGASYREHQRQEKMKKKS